jgi:hypothetical protein
MKNARQMLAGCCTLILVFSFLTLGGCERGDYREGNRGYISGDDGGYNRGYIRKERHYYRDGRWYKHDSRGNEIAVVALAIGALIESLPPQHTTVVVQNASYYHDGSYYYRKAPNGGYAVVSPPAIVHPQSQSNSDKRGEGGGNGHKEGNRGEGH